MGSVRTVTIRLALVAVIVLSCGAAPAADTTELFKPNERWIRVTTPHFVFYSNASEKKTRRVGADLEELRSVLRTLFGGMSFTSPVPTTIFVFDDLHSFAPYGLTYDGKAKRVAGYFGAGRYANHVAIVADRFLQDVSSTVYHEYIHSVLHSNYPALPLWLDEGLAELYSTFEVVRGVARIGAPVYNHLVWLREHPIMPISRLLEVDHSSPEYNENARRGDFYALSWALTHMIVLGRPDSPAQTAAYFALLRRGETPERAFQTAFATTTRDIQRELKAYVNNKRFPIVTLPVQAEIPRRATVTPVSYPDVLTRLGTLLTSLGDDRHPAAERHFRAALEADPSYGPAMAGLARLAELDGHREDALAGYRAAAATTDGDVMTDFFLGRLIGEILRTEAVSTDERGELLAAARSALRRAVVYRSSFGEAWAELGTISALEPRDGEAAIEALEVASRLLPRRGDIGVNLTALYIEQGKIDDAEGVIARMWATGIDPAMIRTAERMIPPAVEKIDGRANAEVRSAESDAVPRRTEGFTERYNEAVALINGGRLEAAADALEALLDDELIEREINRAAALLDNVRGYISFRTATEQATALSNRGEIDAAIAILEPLVDRPPGGVDTTEVRRMLAKLHRYRDFQSTYNGAVDLFNDGSYGRARSLLEPLLGTAPTPRLEWLAAQLLDEIDRVQGD